MKVQFTNMATLSPHSFRLQNAPPSSAVLPLRIESVTVRTVPVLESAPPFDAVLAVKVAPVIVASLQLAIAPPSRPLVPVTVLPEYSPPVTVNVP